jgi:hypothetical protein
MLGRAMVSPKEDCCVGTGESHFDFCIGEELRYAGTYV